MPRKDTAQKISTSRAAPGLYTASVNGHDISVRRVRGVHDTKPWEARVPSLMHTSAHSTKAEAVNRAAEAADDAPDIAVAVRLRGGEWTGHKHNGRWHDVYREAREAAERFGGRCQYRSAVDMATQRAAHRLRRVGVSAVRVTCGSTVIMERASKS